MKRNLLIALGGNLTSTTGGPAKTQRAALNTLKEQGAVIRALSRSYHTPAFPAGAGPEFVNAAAVIRADWTPQQALERLHGVEAQFGRTRDTRWGQRTLDIDLIAVDDLVLPDLAGFKHWHQLPLEDQLKQTPSQLILPHPRLQDRAFVLVPLADVAPGWVHPVLGQTVRQMCDALPEAERASVVPI